MKKTKHFLKKKYLIVLAVVVFFIAILVICFRVEIRETNPQFLKCNFNQVRYDSAIAEYNKCLEEESKVPFDPSKFPEDFPAMGFMPCGLEPEKNEFYDQTIEYNLARRTQLKFLGNIIYERKRAKGKNCSDFGLED